MTPKERATKIVAEDLDGHTDGYGMCNDTDRLWNDIAAAIEEARESDTDIHFDHVIESDAREIVWEHLNESIRKTFNTEFCKMFSKNDLAKAKPHQWSDISERLILALREAKWPIASSVEEILKDNDAYDSKLEVQLLRHIEKLRNSILEDKKESVEY